MAAEPRKNLKTGKWEVQFTLPLNDRGESRRAYCVARYPNTKTECARLMDVAIKLHLAPTSTAGKMTFRQFFEDDFIKNYPASAGVSSSQLYLYKWLVGEIACDELGHLPIGRVDGAVVAKLVAKLVSQTKMDAAIAREKKRAAGTPAGTAPARPPGLADGSIEGALAVLRRVQAWATEADRAPGMRLRESVEQFLEARNFAESTAKRYRYHLSRHVLPHIGDVPIGKVDESVIQKLAETLSSSGRRQALYVPGALKRDGTLKREWELARDRKRGIKANLPSDKRFRESTIRTAVTQIQTVLSLAKDRGIIKEIPKIMKPPKSEATMAPPHTVDEARALMKAAPTEERRLIHHFSYDTGARQSELIGFEWEQVLWDRHKINFDRQIYRGAHKQTKGKRKRVIDMTPELEAALRRWRDQRGNVAKLSPYVFCHDDGTPYSDSNLRRFEDEDRAASGLRKVRWHDKRHTAASNAHAGGKDAKGVQDFLGHADLRTTEGYLHSEHRPHRSILDDGAAQITDIGSKARKGGGA